MILDKHAALERIEHDHELYDEICEIFRDDVPKIIAQLKTAYTGGDFPLATRHAHSLKSSAANIGATELSETARVTEYALRAGEHSNIHTLISTIDQNMSHVLEALS
jgi:two-component system sensor histidine kinase/response regulator